MYASIAFAVVLQLHHTYLVVQRHGCFRSVRVLSEVAAAG